MCGRYTLTDKPETISRHFEVSGPPDLFARYNIAPSQQVVAVRARGTKEGRELVFVRWGLISVDTKKTELICHFRNKGRSWCKAPPEVNAYDYLVFVTWGNAEAGLRQAWNALAWAFAAAGGGEIETEAGRLNAEEFQRRVELPPGLAPTG